MQNYRYIDEYKAMVYSLNKDLQAGDWFVLMQLSRNCTLHFFRDFIRELVSRHVKMRREDIYWTFRFVKKDIEHTGLACRNLSYLQMLKCRGKFIADNNIDVKHTLTTNSDLHYCEETQMAASTLVCSTHNTQLFTFSWLRLLTRLSSIRSRPWVCARLN